MGKNKFTTLFFGLLWLGATFWTILIYDKSVFSLSYGHPEEVIQNFSEKKILKNTTITGSFVAEKENLGTLTLNFSMEQRRVSYQDEDKLIFRIREKNSQKWHYENIYRSGMIYDSLFFPFGFPIIENSKGKTYEFELNSLLGNEENALSLRKGYPTVESRYLVSREKLNSPLSLIQFFSDKFLSRMTTVEVVFISIISFLPFFVYAASWTLSCIIPYLKTSFSDSLSVKKKMPSSDYDAIYKMLTKGLMVSVLILVLVDIFVIQTRTDVIYVVVIAIFVKSLKSNRKADLISGLISLFLLVICPILLAYDSSFALRSAAWSLIYFAISVFFVILKRDFSR